MTMQPFPCYPIERSPTAAGQERINLMDAIVASVRAVPDADYKAQRDLLLEFVGRCAMGTVFGDSIEADIRYTYQATRGAIELLQEIVKPAYWGVPQS